MSGLSGLQLGRSAEALVTLCRREAPPPDLADRPGFRTPEFQAALATLAQRHGLFGLMLLALERSALLPELPANVREDFTRSLRLLRRQAALWDLERDFVLTLLLEREIPAVLLKGAALRLTAYSDPVQRPFGDLDVLVPEAAVDQAVEALTRAGYQSEIEQRARLYREHHHHLILRKPLGFVVEVHWALEPVRSPFRLDPAAFRRDALPVKTRQGVSVWIPSAEHFVLHLSTQSIEDGFSRLGRIVDLDRVIATSGSAFDWDLLAAEAIRMRVQGVTALSLRLCELLFRTPVPSGCYERLRLAWLPRAHLALLDPIGLLLEQRSQTRASLERLLLLWSVPDRRQRLAVLRAMHAGEQDWFTQLLPPGEGQPGAAARMLSILKLGLYQLWLYLSAAAGRLSGLRRVRRFWSARLDSAA